MATKSELRVGVKFETDNKALESSRKELEKLLSSAQQIKTAFQSETWQGGFNLKEGFKEAAKEADKLSGILSKSWDLKSGQLNLSTFRKEINNAYGGITNFRTNLEKLGPSGSQAFNKVASSILSTNVELKQSNQLLDKMALTMANTIRFGISSSIFNNFTSSISKAYSYVKNLDTSLNDIRIVSGQSAEQMNKFAKYANQAAQSLGATTLDYTKASQIYFQQGLNTDEVTKRTDVTIKMANVLGSSAQEVSDYMTAIWNNFDNGSESLEHYADVITALGASTASSSEEIATGLEKFASVANTVGLSYEYATSALATVVAETRQSADTVGTAFKTLFARIQDLELGETLDDGTTLGKYAEALEKVGINIKDESGNLKEMDTILSEMGNKWQSLSKAQQVALAQSVAGTRQYSQLIALMDNWDKFEQNLTTAGNAAGTLEKQQEVYLDSMQAHLKSLQAEAEKFYKLLLDEKSIKTFVDMFTGAFKTLNSYLTGFGGGFSQLFGLGGNAVSLFSKQLGGVAAKAQQNFNIETRNRDQENYKKQVAQEITAQYQMNGVDNPNAERINAEADYSMRLLSIRQDISKEMYEQLAAQQEIYGQLAESIGAAQNWEEELRKVENFTKEDASYLQDKESLLLRSTQLTKQANIDSKKMIDAQMQSDDIIMSLEGKIGKERKQILATRAKELDDALSQIGIEKTTREYYIKNLADAKQHHSINKKINEAYEERNDQLDKTYHKAEAFNEAARQYQNLQDGTTQKQIEHKRIIDEHLKAQEESVNLAKAYQSTISGVGTVISSFSAVVGAFKTWGNPDLTGWEKLKSTFTTLTTQGLILASNWSNVINIFSNLKVVLNAQNASLIKRNLLLQTENILRKKNLTEEEKQAMITNITAAAEAKRSATTITGLIKENALLVIRNALLKAGPILIAGAVVAVTAAVIAIVRAINKVKKEQDSWEEKIKKAQESVKQVTDEYNELVQTINSAEEARKKIDSLTEGTIEFYQAIEEANTKLKELIDKLKLVKGIDYTYDENGMIVINQKSLENAEFKEHQRVYRATASQKEIELQKAQSEYNNILDEFFNEVNSKSKWALISQDQALKILDDPLKDIVPYGYDENGNVIGYQTKDYKTYNPWGQIGILANHGLDESDVPSEKDYPIDGLEQDITDIVSEYKLQFKKAQAALQEAQFEYAVNIIRGTGTKNQVDYFNTLTKTQQTVVGQIIGEKQQQIDKDYEKNVEEEIKKNTKAGQEAQEAENYKQHVIESPFTNLWDVIGAQWSQRSKEKNVVSQEQYIKEKYYVEQNDDYTLDQLEDMRLNNKDKYKEIMDKVNYDDAKTWYKNNQTNKDLNPILQRISDQKQDLYNKGYDETQTNYIMDAVLSIQRDIKQQTGTADKATGKEAYDVLKALGINTDNLQELQMKVLEHSEEELTYINEKGEKTSVKIKDISSDLESLILKANELDDTVKSVDRLREQIIEYNNTITEQANQLGTTVNALKAYDAAMQGASGEEQKFTKETAKAAAEEYKFNKEYNNGRKIYEDNKDAIQAYVKALKNQQKVSYDVADAAGELLDTLKDIGIILKASDLKDDNVFKQVQKLLTGTEKEAEEAYKALYDISRKNALIDFFGGEEAVKNSYGTMEKITNILKGIDETKPGKMLAEEYAEQLRQMINDTEHSIEEINELSQALDIEIPVSYNTPDKFEMTKEEFTTGAQSVLHEYVGEMPNPNYGLLDNRTTIPVNYKWVETIQDKTESFLVPKDANFQVNTNKHNLNSTKNFKAASNNKGSSSEPNKKDPIKTEIDRYHKVNTQITKVDNSLKKLQSQQEKFVGSKLLGNLNAQWADLNTQIENYNEKLRIANEEQAELADKLSAKGVAFNADGTVNNYAEAIRAQEAYVNSLIDNYNHMSSEAQKKYEESTLKPAEEAFEQFKTDIDRYDELISSFIPDIKQSIQDSLDKQIEINITKFNLEIEITLDMDQATRDWNAWAKRAIQGFDAEDIFGNAQARLKDFYTYFNEQGTADVQVGMKHVNDILEELRKLNNSEDDVFGDNKKKALEQLEEHYTQLMQSITDVIELQDELHQDWLDKMDEVQEKFSKQVSAYEFLRNVLDHDIKLIQMNLGEDAYAEMTKFYDAQQKNYEKQLEFQRQQKDFWYAQMQAAEEGSKEWESAREKWQDAVNEFNSILESGLENAKTKFENAINDIFKKLNDSLTGGLGLEYVNTQWDLINKNADRYLDTINSTYAIRELEKKYVDSINKTNNVTTQQRLQKVMDEQLENLKQRERLTQYDVDRANKLYEIEMARIALEEAQKNKSQMRLRRDSQGNYSYQYVADDAAINEAEDQLSGLYNDLYNFDKERYNSVLNDIYSTWSEYQEQMAAAALINDPELRAEKQALIQKEYNELMMQIETDYQTSKYNLQESFFTDWVNLNDMTLESFKNLTDNEKDIIMTEMVPTWKNGITEMIEMITGEGGFAEVTQSAWENMVAAEKEYTQDITNLEDVSQQTFDAIAQGQDENIARSQELIKQNDELIDAYGKELQAVKEIYDQVKALRDMFKETEQAAIATAEAAYKALHQEQEQAQSDYANQNASTSSSSSNPNGSSDITSGVTSGGGAGGSGNGSPEVGDTATYNGGKYYSTSYGGGSWGSRSSGTQVRITIVKAGRPYPIHIANLNGGALGWIREDQISGYDTGGYTGTWNNNGRLALLHQKELVLNAQDTENMLNAVSVMRSLTYSLGSSVLARMAGVGANGINGGGATDGVLEQNVHIEAEFPNVHNAAEIEEALNNLVNSASQRVMEKR